MDFAKAINTCVYLDNKRERLEEVRPVALSLRLLCIHFFVLVFSKWFRFVCWFVLLSFLVSIRFTVSKEDVLRLLQYRIEYHHMFVGKRGTAMQGWK